MPAFGLILMSYRIIGVVVFPVVLAGGSAALAWRLQDWLYGRQLAERVAGRETRPVDSGSRDVASPRRMLNELSPSPTQAIAD
ncbi:hypothetical protein FHW68_002268 [Pseudomonas sp. Tn43]|nr:hypothetical protein [Pseudomonas sp. Tn43]